MAEIRLSFYAPGLSKADLADLLEQVVVSSKSISVDTKPEGAELSADPATITLIASGIAAGGVTVASIIQAVTQVYLKWKQEKAKQQKVSEQRPDTVTVTVSGTLGNSWIIKVTNNEQIEMEVRKLPADHNEIARIRLE